MDIVMASRQLTNCFQLNSSANVYGESTVRHAFSPVVTRLTHHFECVFVLLQLGLALHITMFIFFS